MLDFGNSIISFVMDKYIINIIMNKRWLVTLVADVLRITKLSLV